MLTTGVDVLECFSTLLTVQQNKLEYVINKKNVLLGQLRESVF
jgi:hypothetical protein